MDIILVISYTTQDFMLWLRSQVHNNQECIPVTYRHYIIGNTRYICVTSPVDIRGTISDGYYWTTQAVINPYFNELRTLAALSYRHYTVPPWVTKKKNTFKFGR